MSNLLRSMAELQPQIVGALACQKDSFLKELSTVVVRCVPDTTNKKSTKFAVELQDTVIFPEGGGQHSDQGHIVESATGARHFVEHCRREKLSAMHVVSSPLEPGTPVDLEVDWPQRFDHMQQHTGQHLLSAILDMRSLPTLSWGMTDMINYVEIPRALTEDEVREVGDEIAEKILEDLEITVTVPKKEDVKQDKLPDDYDVEKGVLRVVSIGGIDQNPCCGTHLHRTSQIMAVTLLHQSSVRGTNSRLYFICGDRVRKYAAQCHKLLRQSSQELSCQFENLHEKIGLLDLNYRKSSKKEGQWKEEVAKYQTKEIIEQFNDKDVVVFYRPDVGLDYLNVVFKNISKQQPQDKTLVMLCGEGKDGGSIIINSSDQAKTMEIAKHLQTLIGGMKGGGKTKWQGKTSTFAKGELDAALEYLRAL